MNTVKPALLAAAFLLLAGTGPAAAVCVKNNTGWVLVASMPFHDNQRLAQGAEVCWENKAPIFPMFTVTVFYRAREMWGYDKPNEPVTGWRCDNPFSTNDTRITVTQYGDMTSRVLSCSKK